MPQRSNGPPPRHQLLVVLPWLLWGLLLVAWTFGLLWPHAHEVGEWFVPDSKKFWAAKALHASAYAFLALVVWFMSGRPRVRLAVWASLIAHGALTEFLQPYFRRDGSIYDVMLDTTGILVGVGVGLVLRRLWRG